MKIGWILFLSMLIATALAAWSMPNLDSHGYWLQHTKSRIRNLGVAAANEHWRYGRYPADYGELTWIFDTSIKDYWGNSFVYSLRDTGAPYIYSAGPNGVDEFGAGDDVVSEDKEYECSLYDDCLTLKDHINTASVLTMLVTLLALFSLFIRKMIKMARNKF